MKRAPDVYLDDIPESLTRIKNYVNGLSFKEFSNDQKTIDAVLRNFEIIGEASKQVPDGFKSKYTEMPWKEMAGMRNILIHTYFGVNLKIIWRTITTRIPELTTGIQNILEDSRSDG